jgi:tripartite-type tricarboxylate transporter receptor subunit TctC
LKLAGAIAMLAATAQAGAAQPIRLVVAFPPGGPADQLARLISIPLEKELKNNIIVENKPGANGAIAASYVAKSPADGSVLFLSSVGAISINPSLYPKLIYDPVKDLAPISLVVNTAEMLVVPAKDPARNAAEFVANSRKAANPPSLASSGIGSMPHMAIEQLIDSTGVNYMHVAYKGAAPAITDTIGGQVNGFIGDVPGILSFIKTGRLKALGVATEKRLPFMPEVPTLKEQGIKNVEAINWYGMFAPAGTPKPVVDSLSKAIARVMTQPEMKAKIYEIGAEPAPNSPSEFAALIQRDTAKWGAIVKAKNIRPE